MKFQDEGGVHVQDWGDLQTICPLGLFACTFIFLERSKTAIQTLESTYQPEPLTVEIQIQMLQYRSVEEAFLSLI